MLERTNNQIGETNGRVLPLLETLTGQTLGGDQEPWRKWWTEQLGYVYDDRYTSKPTLTDSVAVPDLSVVAPACSWQSSRTPPALPPVPWSTPWTVRENRVDRRR